MERNQYPPDFFEPIIMETMEKIIKESPNQPQTQTLTPPEKQQETQKHRIKIQYRGTLTDNYVKQLKQSGVPVQTVNHP